jgi:hypothetical protein
MSKDEETTEKPAEAPKEPEAKRTRKIVRRSASTRENPAFAEAQAAAPEAAPAPAPAAEAAPAPATEAASAPAAEAASAPAAAPPAEGAPRPRPRATFDARAPRPARPAPGAPGEHRERREHRGDYRPPAARPMGSRPLPGGSRAPAAPGAPGGEDRPRREPRPRRDEGGDYRPPAARPMGARPLPGGSRAPAPAREHGERPRREHRPDAPAGVEPRAPRARAPHDDAAAKPALAKGDAPAKAPTAPANAPAAPAKPETHGKGPAQKAAAPKPLPVFIPLPKAGQVAASNKPALTPKEALAAKTKAHAAKAAKPATKASEPPPAETAPSFDPALVQATAEEAAAALGKAGEAAGQLVDAWLAASNAAAIAEAAEAEGVPSLGRKAARRAINVLRARGVALPTRSRVAKIDDRAEVSVEATLVPPDATGVFALTISRREASGRYHVAEVIMREQTGVLQAGSGWLSGTKVKQVLGRHVEGFGLSPVSVPVEWARYRIAAARRQNALSGQVLPLGFEGCREVVEPAPDAEPPHPLADLLADVTSERAATAALMSGSLHNEPEFAGWLPDRPALDELLLKVGERLDPEDREATEKIAGVVKEESEAATDRFFSPEVRNVIAQRMRDAAISVRARAGDRRAAEVLGVARAVREAGLITSPPREIPFLVAFFDKALSILARQGGGQIRIPMRMGARAPVPSPEGSTEPSPTE